MSWRGEVHDAHERRAHLLQARAHFLYARLNVAHLRAVLADTARDDDQKRAEDAWHYAILAVDYRRMAKNYLRMVHEMDVHREAMRKLFLRASAPLTKETTS